MFQPTAQPTTPKKLGACSSTPTVCIVDPQQSNYPDWDSLASSQGVRLLRFTNADEALRFSRTAAVDLWVINTQLPGLSGCELCSMLRSRSPQAAVYLVANEYSPAEERSAWQARATLFLCQGAHATSLADWCEHRRTTANSAN